MMACVHSFIGFAFFGAGMESGATSAPRLPLAAFAVEGAAATTTPTPAPAPPPAFFALPRLPTFPLLRLQMLEPGTWILPVFAGWCPHSGQTTRSELDRDGFLGGALLLLVLFAARSARTFSHPGDPKVKGEKERSACIFVVAQAREGNPVRRNQGASERDCDGEDK